MKIFTSLEENLKNLYFNQKITQEKSMPQNTAEKCKKALKGFLGQYKCFSSSSGDIIYNWYLDIFWQNFTV